MLRFSKDPDIRQTLEDLFQKLKQEGFNFSIDTVLTFEDLVDNKKQVPLAYIYSGMDASLEAQGFSPFQKIEFDCAILDKLMQVIVRIVAEKQTITQDITLPLVITFEIQDNLSKIRIDEDGYSSTESIGVMKKGSFTLELIEALFELWYRMRILGLPSDLPDGFEDLDD